MLISYLNLCKKKVGSYKSSRQYPIPPVRTRTRRKKARAFVDILFFNFSQGQGRLHEIAMALKYLVFSFLLINLGKVESASLLERSYDYVMNLGKSLAPNLLAILDCLNEDDPWLCSKEKATKMLDAWEKENDEQRRSWQGQLHILNY